MFRTSSILPSSNYDELREILKSAKHILIISGAGISAESGIPTFRGSEGLWRKLPVSDLATVAAFERSPSLVWEFHHFGRELILSKEPNLAHIALAELENKLKAQGRSVTIVTQNVDGLHQRAGSEEVIELHGTLFKTLCTKCKHIADNDRSPICPALEGRGDPSADPEVDPIPVDLLPTCEEEDCGGLLRPYTVWFGEGLDQEVIKKTALAMMKCEVCLVIGTSSVVYPAAMFAPAIASKGLPVAEFNLGTTPATPIFKFHFRGPCTETVTEALRGVLD